MTITKNHKRAINMDHSYTVIVSETTGFERFIGGREALFVLAYRLPLHELLCGCAKIHNTLVYIHRGADSSLRALDMEDVYYQ